MESYVKNNNEENHRSDIIKVADYIRKEGEVSIGEIALKFNWGSAKTSFVVNAVLDTHEDIHREGRHLKFDAEE